jgi:hypothetical protein
MWPVYLALAILALTAIAVVLKLVQSHNPANLHQVLDGIDLEKAPAVAARTDRR